MTDLLLQEFHEAGIFLEGEITGVWQADEDGGTCSIVHDGASEGALLFVAYGFDETPEENE